MLDFTQSDPLSPARCRKRAMDALARREHSRAELEHKLLEHGFPADVVAVTLDRLAAERLQCDERFVEAFVASRYRQGKGPRRIHAELAQRGIASAAIDAAIRGSGFDWGALAARVRQQKFGHAPPPDFPARAKQLRFLTYRGFEHDQLRAAFGEVEPID